MIDNVSIKNFKSIKSLEINCNPSFNVIIGKNNIGKTSIFEAIHLWKICYDTNIKKSNNRFFYSAAKNIVFSNNEFLRVFDDKDLINKDMYSNNKDIEIVVHIKYNEIIYALGFIISKVSNIDNAYLQVSYTNKNEFDSFASVVSQSEYNLTNILVICESRPTANIVAKEPYMFKRQIIDKISRGKGYEVLRNKIIKSNSIKESIENHISNVMDEEYRFIEVDKENKTYIKLLANDSNILSQGSGFLQIAEIFSSLEYTQAGMYILLIDEPDSHLHMSLQHKLVEELREISNSQTLVITHNDKFINSISEEEILLITDTYKNQGSVSHLPNGCKNLILQNLSGTIEKIELLRNANKVILCEGASDINFFNKLIEKYVELVPQELPCLFLEQLYGIDTLNNKLLSYSRAYAGISQENAKWIVIRDSDCLPISKQEQSKRKNIQYITTIGDKEIIFQKGYGIESTFISEFGKIVSLIIKYYELEDNDSNQGIIGEIITKLKSKYATDVVNCLTPVHKELSYHFNRQIEARQENKCLIFTDMLQEISSENIEYIMTKSITNMFFKSIHDNVTGLYGAQENEALKYNTLIDFYFASINTVADIYECHNEILQIIIT